MREAAGDGRDGARATFAASGLDYGTALTKPNLVRLAAYIDQAMVASGAVRGSLRMRRSLNLRRRDGRIVGASLRCKGFYFDDREAVTFNEDGFVGFAGWADDTNVRPVVAGFSKWLGEFAGAARAA
jgi:hypothetical protein